MDSLRRQLPDAETHVTRGEFSFNDKVLNFEQKLSEFATDNIHLNFVVTEKFPLKCRYKNRNFWLNIQAWNQKEVLYGAAYFDGHDVTESLRLDKRKKLQALEIPPENVEQTWWVHIQKRKRTQFSHWMAVITPRKTEVKESDIEFE